MTKEKFVTELYNIGAIKFGNFTLKSGLISPFYIDLRDTVSNNELLDMITELLYQKVKDLQFDVVSGIPYTAMPFAVLLAKKLDKPLIFMRKEKKDYGTKNDIIGKYEKNAVCLVIDDLITTGLSKIETANKLEENDIVVKDFVVLIDRSKSGKEDMKQAGYNLHSVITLQEVVDILVRKNLLSKDKAAKILDFVNNSETLKRKKENDFIKKLKEKIIKKRSNLVLSLDVDNSKEFFDILDKTAKSIVMLKTHIDIISDFNENFIKKLKSYAEKFDFLIFEDRKFADIGNTVNLQYHKGIYKISSWADYITVHLVAGEGTLTGLFKDFTNGSAFILGGMSSKNNLIDENYTNKAIEIAKKHSHLVSGFIGHGKDEKDLKAYKEKLPKDMLLLVPGVKLQRGSDSMGQQYITVEEAIRGGADCIIVGRGIIKSDDAGKTAELYRQKAWEIYKQTI